ncbi:MAG TPA: phage holin family protein [Nakamurella sp.]|nr:phage holin family protein [Nakamurella sp.]
MAASSAAHPPTDYSRQPTGPASIPLVPEDAVDRNGSIGALVKDASVHMSTLVRSEIELAKLEMTASVKQALRGSIFFAGAAAIGLFSLWFFWLMVGEILDIWLPRWAAFTIVFVVMLAMAGGLAFLGIRRVKKIRKPEKTIAEAQQTAATLKQAASRTPETPETAA